MTTSTETLDISTLDFGNEIAAPAAPAAPAAEAQPQPPAPKKPAEQPAEPNGQPAENPVEKPAEQPAEPAEQPSGDDAPRDEKGRFAERDVKIPKARFDEAVNKEREAREAAERRAQELERQLAAAAQTTEEAARITTLETEIEALELKYQELLLDGDTAEAAKVMRQIRVSERQIATAEAEARAAAQTNQILETERIGVLIARLEADYPELNPRSEVYDADIVDLILSKQRTLMNQGLTPTQAMEKASADVTKRFLTKAEEPAQQPTDGLAAAAVAEDRKKAAVAKALETQQAQPASMKEAGLDSDKAGMKDLPDVTKLTAEEFAALPQATRDRLMGNLV